MPPACLSGQLPAICDRLAEPNYWTTAVRIRPHRLQPENRTLATRQGARTKSPQLCFRRLRPLCSCPRQLPRRAGSTSASLIRHLVARLPKSAIRSTLFWLQLIDRESCWQIPLVFLSALRCLPNTQPNPVCWFPQNHGSVQERRSALPASRYHAIHCLPPTPTSP